MHPTLYFTLPIYYKSWEVLDVLRKLEKSQWLSPSELERIQLKKLRALVKHAYENVPLYHETFRKVKLKPADISSLEDIQKIPITTKDDLINNSPNKTVARNYDVQKLRKGQTGGSTGKPLSFFFDKRCFHHRMAAFQRFASWFGFYPGVKHALFWRPYYLSSPKIASTLEAVMKRRLEFHPHKITKQALHEQVRKLKRFKPRILIGYTSLLLLLANFLKQEDIKDINPTAIVTQAETLFESQKKVIESAFNCPVFNHYGLVEVGGIAQQCDQHSYLHINAEGRIVEFLRRGENVSFGEKGEMVVTDLYNYAMPFIRYNTDDVGLLTDDSCTCGRGLPLIKEVVGRADDLIVAKDGEVVSWTFFYFAPHLFKNGEWVQQYQIVQPSREKLVIKIVKAAEPKEEHIQYLKSNIRKYLGDMQIEIEFVESIPLSPSGKFRFVISHVAPKMF